MTPADTDARERIGRLEDVVYGDSDTPGIVLRLDRIERTLDLVWSVVKWATGGGILSLAATFVLLYKILYALPTS